VLAFPLDAHDVTELVIPAGATRGPDRAPIDPGDMPLLLGDVVICPAVAAAQAPEHAGTLDDELALLLVHGILHVLGHDHAEPAEALAMRARELEILERHHWQGPAPVAFRQEQE
jgi:probable rRNA maturation factor